MNISDKLKSYPGLEELISKSAKLSDILDTADEHSNSENLQLILSLIDLTTLDVCDTHAKVISMCNRINNFNKSFPDYKNVAAICVYPALVPVVKNNLSVPEINIASVVGGFPASQTFSFN